MLNKLQNQSKDTLDTIRKKTKEEVLHHRSLTQVRLNKLPKAGGQTDAQMLKSLTCYKRKQNLAKEQKIRMQALAQNIDIETSQFIEFAESKGAFTWQNGSPVNNKNIKTSETSIDLDANDVSQQRIDMNNVARSSSEMRDTGYASLWNKDLVRDITDFSSQAAGLPSVYSKSKQIIDKYVGLQSSTAQNFYKSERERQIQTALTSPGRAMTPDGIVPQNSRFSDGAQWDEEYQMTLFKEIEDITPQVYLERRRKQERKMKIEMLENAHKELLVKQHGFGKLRRLNKSLISQKKMSKSSNDFNKIPESKSEENLRQGTGGSERSVRLSELKINNQLAAENRHSTMPNSPKKDLKAQSINKKFITRENTISETTNLLTPSKIQSTVSNSNLRDTETRQATTRLQSTPSDKIQEHIQQAKKIVFDSASTLTPGSITPTRQPEALHTSSSDKSKSVYKRSVQPQIKGRPTYSAQYDASRNSSQESDVSGPRDILGRNKVVNYQKFGQRQSNVNQKKILNNLTDMARKFNAQNAIDRKPTTDYETRRKSRKQSMFNKEEYDPSLGVSKKDWKLMSRKSILVVRHKNEATKALEIEAKAAVLSMYLKQGIAKMFQQKIAARKLDELRKSVDEREKRKTISAGGNHNIKLLQATMKRAITKIKRLETSINRTTSLGNSIKFAAGKAQMKRSGVYKKVDHENIDPEMLTQMYELRNDSDKSSTSSLTTMTSDTSSEWSEQRKSFVTKQSQSVSVGSVSVSQRTPSKSSRSSVEKSAEKPKIMFSVGGNDKTPERHQTVTFMQPKPKLVVDKSPKTRPSNKSAVANRKKNSQQLSICSRLKSALKKPSNTDLAECKVEYLKPETNHTTALYEFQKALNNTIVQSFTNWRVQFLSDVRLLVISVQTEVSIMFAKKRSIWNDEKEAQAKSMHRGYSQVMQVRKEEKAAIEEHQMKIVELFHKFISDYEQDKQTVGRKMLLFVILKSEGDLFQQLCHFDRAIKVYKILKNYCDQWDLKSCKMKMYEQIGICYRTTRQHSLAVDYFKKQLQIAWQIGSKKAETLAYLNISQEYFYIGDLVKMRKYYDRMFRGKTENNDSTFKINTIGLLKHKREFYGPKHNVLYTLQSGIDKPDIEKGPDYCFSHFCKGLPYEHFSSGEEEDEVERHRQRTIENREKEQRELADKRRRTQRLRFKSMTGLQIKQERNKYTPSKVSVQRKHDPKPYSEERFRKLVKTCQERFYLKNKDATWDDHHPFRTNLSILRFVPMTEIKDSTMMQSCSTTMDKMEKNLQILLRRFEQTLKQQQYA